MMKTDSPTVDSASSQGLGIKDNLAHLDFAAIHTLLNGGTIYPVEPEKVPQAPAVAIFRY